VRVPPYPYREFQGSEGCRIAFYRWDGSENVFLYSFPAARYLEETVYPGFPVSCRPNVWAERFTIFGGDLAEEDLESIHANGPWSDINQNGAPEFAVIYQYCSNACLNHGAVAVHLYEIQTTSKIVDLTANLPGVIDPIKGFIHSLDPVEIYVHDPTLWYCYKFCIIDTWWIYSWDGRKFVNVSGAYADEYRAIGEKIVETVLQKEAVSFREWDFLEILFHYEKAGLGSEGIEIFLDITDPMRWSRATPVELCWLQFARASILDDFETGRPFRFPRFQLAFLDLIALDAPSILERIMPEMDTQKYDLSECIALLPSPD